MATTNYKTDDSYSKVEWLINILKDPKKRDQFIKQYKYQDTVSFGTVCKATGVGKSIDMYMQVIKLINDYREGKIKKLVINLSSPRLLLSQQTTKRLVILLKELNLIDTSNTCLVVNSSDSKLKWDKLFDGMGFDIYSRNQITGAMDIYIVTSCYKSEAKFYKLLENELKDYYKLSLFDESQKVDLVKKDILNEDDNYIDIDRHIRLYDKCFAYSATPEEHLTKKLIEAENVVRTAVGVKAFAKEYVSYVSPQKAISDFKILPPKLYINQTELTDAAKKADFCEQALAVAKGENPEIDHKMLVTVANTQDLANVRNILISKGYKVFATCSKDGMTTDNESMDDATIEDFIADVENYNGDCFVIHIRQLTEGIDLGGLTDTIIFTLSDVNNYATIIQNVGRVLRFKNSTERNQAGKSKSLNKLTKKCGRVFFITETDDKVDVVKNFFFTCYGINYYGFSKNFQDAGSFSSLTINPWYDAFAETTEGSKTVPAGIQELPYELTDFCRDLVKLSRFNFGPDQTKKFAKELHKKINGIVNLANLNSHFGNNSFFVDEDSDVMKKVKQFVKKNYPELKKYL